MAKAKSIRLQESFTRRLRRPVGLYEAIQPIYLNNHPSKKAPINIFKSCLANQAKATKAYLHFSISLDTWVNLTEVKVSVF